jgi:uncharacterized protein
LGPIRRGALAALACSIALLVPTSVARAAPEYPAVDGWIVDGAEQVPDDVEARIETELQAFFERSGNEVAVAVVPEMGGAEVEDYTHDLFNKWGVGNKRRDVGVLLLVAMQERRMRIETGYGAEELITDVEANEILDSYVKPRMRDGDVGAAVDHGQRAIRVALGDTSPDAAVASPAEPPEPESPSGTSILFGLLPFIVMALVFSSVFGSRRRRSRGLGGIWGYPIFYGGGHYGGHHHGGFGGGFGGGGD